jgi:hypothetical protein
MHSPSDGPPTEDRAGTEASQELRDACAVLMNRTDCKRIRVFDAERGKIDYDSKRVYISQNVLGKIYHQFDAECLYAEGGHAEFIYIGTECPEN